MSKNNDNLRNEDVVLKTKEPFSRTNILATVMICILGVLAIVTIIMAIVPKSYAVHLSDNNPHYIFIYEGSSTPATTLFADEHKEDYDKLLSAYEKSFKQSSLSALFQKELFNKIEYDYLGTNDKTLSNIVTSNDYVLGFVYSQEQTLYRNGDPYVCEELKYLSQYKDGVVKFKKVWITVNNENGVNTVNFYFQRLASEGGSESSYAILQITTKGLQENLFNTIEEILK